MRRATSAVQETDDYIIADAGTAGCVLANRLSEGPSLRVLSLEAGGNGGHSRLRVPIADAVTLGSTGAVATMPLSIQAFI